MANLRRALLFTIPRILNSTANPTLAAVGESSIRSQTLYRPIPNLFSRLYSSTVSSSSKDFDLSNEESKRQLVNRLVYRSKQRGYLELDLILGGWVEDHIRSLDENGIKALIDVLDLGWWIQKCVFNGLMFCSGNWIAQGFDYEYTRSLGQENPDLWKWLTGQEQPPEAISKNPVFVAVHNKVMNNLDNHASPETRAIPGKPWVRGWDDFKKGRDSPIVGNQ